MTEVLPKYKPCKGVAIIAFTAEQVATYNIRLFGDGKEFVISDSWHPDEHSIEEAVIVGVNDVQKELKQGDSVLVDYAVFSSGRQNDDRLREDHSRFLGRVNDYYLYWCYDDTHSFNSSEIFGFVDDTGGVTAFGDAVIIYPPGEEQLAFIEPANQRTLLTDIYNILPHAIWAVVKASPVKEIKEGDRILCEQLTVKIKFRGIEMHYINLPYIFGTAAPDSPFGLKLF